MLILQPLNEIQGLSQLHGQGPWLMCELALRQHVGNTMYKKRPRPRHNKGKHRRQQHRQPPTGHFTNEIEGLWALHFKYSRWWKRWSWSKFSSHYAWGTNKASKWMQEGCKVYMNSCMILNLSCFMVTWIILKNYLLEVGLTQKWETMALRILTTIDLVYLIMCDDFAWIEINLNSIWLRAPFTYAFTLGPIHMRSQVPSPTWRQNPNFWT